MGNCTWPICRECYAKRYPGREPITLAPEVEVCCDCGIPTTDGIYIREDPRKVKCK